MKIDCEKLTLKNGLTVLLCNEGSAPVLTVGVLYHVGANREEKGRTGFAHLFEHLMFSESQHVPPKVSWRLIDGLGGTMNGWTSVDHTFYFETVPVSGLESALWMESDRMGYLLPTMTPKALATQQGVVINEKLQTDVNVPYGYEWYIKNKLIYGDDHPCGHTVIGETEDLMDATLSDVIAFHEKYYVPCNATLVLCGRFDREEALTLIRKYFEDLPGGTPLPDPKPRPVSLGETKNYYYIDRLAAAPDFSLTFPAVEEFHEDSTPLKALAYLLSDGKASPFYRRIVQAGLAPSAEVYSDGCDIAGEFTATARPLPGVPVQKLYDAMQAAFKDFESGAAGMQAELDRYKAKSLREFYTRLEKSMDRAMLLAYCDEYAGSYGYIETLAERIKGLTLKDVTAAYEKYVKDRPALLFTSLPPDCRPLAMAEAKEWPAIVEPKIDETRFGKPGKDYRPIETLPSSFDRSVQPKEGPIPCLEAPAVEQDRSAAGFRLMADYDDALPLVEGEIIIHGGQQFETLENSGIGRLAASLLTEGTRDRDSAAFDAAVRDLGAVVAPKAGTDCLMLRFQVLKEGFPALMDLLSEALLEPGFREEDFRRLKDRQLEQLRQDSLDPETRADNLFYENVYGRIPVALPTTGTEKSVSGLTTEALRDYYQNILRRSPVTVLTAGPVSLEELRGATAGLRAGFHQGGLLPDPGQAALSPAAPGTVVAVTSEEATQTQIRFGLPAMCCRDPEFFPAHLMNFMLGGCFCSRLNLLLREEKAYTYGASSYFDAERCCGSFVISTSVDAEHAAESLELIRQTVKDYPATLTEEDLAYARSACRKSLLRRRETYGDRRQFLETVARFDYPLDFLLQRERIIDGFTLEKARELAGKYLDLDKLLQVTLGPEEDQE